MCVLSCYSRVWLFAALWTAACKASLSMGFSRQKYWSGLPCPPPRDLPDPGIPTQTSLNRSCIGRWILTTSASWKTPNMMYFSLFSSWPIGRINVKQHKMFEIMEFVSCHTWAKWSFKKMLDWKKTKLQERGTCKVGGFWGSRMTNPILSWMIRTVVLKLWKPVMQHCLAASVGRVSRCIDWSN